MVDPGGGSQKKRTVLYGYYNNAPEGIMCVGVKVGASSLTSDRKQCSSSYSSNNIFTGRKIFKMNQNLFRLSTISDVDVFIGNTKYQSHLRGLQLPLHRSVIHVSIFIQEKRKKKEKNRKRKEGKKIFQMCTARF